MFLWASVRDDLIEWKVEYTYLLVANSELALRLLIRLRIGIKLLDCLIVLCHGLCELDITLCVLMTRENFSIVRQCGQSLVQCLVHLLCCALEEAAASANEHGVAGEDRLVVPILEVETDTVLCVTRGVKSGDLDRSDVECLLVGRSAVDQSAVAAADDWEFVVLKLLQMSQ